MAAEIDYALILMDVPMPGMDGLEATRRIRQLERGADVPIVAMTVSAFADDELRCRQAGMNDFIGKPAPPQHVQAMLKRWLAWLVPWKMLWQTKFRTSVDQRPAPALGSLTSEPMARTLGRQ